MSSMRRISLADALAEEIGPGLEGSVMAEKLTIGVDAAPAIAAIKLLAELAQTRAEAVQAFMNSLDSASQLVCFDSEDLTTPGTGELRIAFQPSDLLREFLAATRAGERDGL